MKRSWILALIFCCLGQGAPGFVYGQTEQAGAPAVVALSFSAAVLQTAEAKRDFSALQTKFASRQAHLQALSAEVESLRKQLNGSSAPSSDTEKSASQQSFDLKERQLHREAEDYKADTDSASQQTFQAVAQKVFAFLQQYAKQHAYSIVIDRGSEANPIVWYAAAKLDITEQLIRAYDTQTNSGPPGTEAIPKASSHPEGSNFHQHRHHSECRLYGGSCLTPV